mgnify:CR=1 FL=1
MQDDNAHCRIARVRVKKLLSCYRFLTYTSHGMEFYRFSGIGAGFFEYELERA